MLRQEGAPMPERIDQGRERNFNRETMAKEVAEFEQIQNFGIIYKRRIFGENCFEPYDMIFYATNSIFL